jgi:hypothetical protein
MILFYSLKNGKIHLKRFIIQNTDFDNKQENSFLSIGLLIRREIYELHYRI